jgi:hypothetical protein
MNVAGTVMYALEIKRRQKLKGKFHGECKRAACRVFGDTVCMWSSVEHAYYCPACAKEIERWSGLVGVPPMVAHTSDTAAEPKR